MSETPPNKQLKQTDVQSFKTESTRDREYGETSEACDNVQKAEEKSCTFQFRIKNGDRHQLFCNISKTVFGALNTNKKIQSFDKMGKEIIIRRYRGKMPGAVVKTDFPCCLIEDDEVLQINLYKNEEIASTDQETTKDTDPKSLVTFYIRTRGAKIKKIMMSKALRTHFDYVCVFAHKGETLKQALQQDGRFIDDILDSDCELIGIDDKRKYALTLPVDCCNDKTFELKVERIVKKPIRHFKRDGESVHHGQQPNNTDESTIQETETKPAVPSTKSQAHLNSSGGSSGDSGASSFWTDLENILRTRCKVVLEMLLEQKNTKVQRFFQEDFDKGVQCFTEVNKVKKIMTLSDSVCLIAVNGSPIGTGFLAFDRFILTNAHVVKDLIDPDTLKLSGSLQAVFNFDVLGSEPKALSVKDDIVAYGFERDERCRLHDFALLQLEAVPDNCSELFEHYKRGSPPNHGGIYIVGHPSGGLKKMDACFIIEPEKQLESINKHISENISCPYVTWQCWPLLHHNRITYDSCIYHGSSGSPVFDEHCFLIGMHSGGFHYQKDQRDRSVIEFAYSMSSIIKDIATQVKTRREILKLLQKFKSIKSLLPPESTKDTSETNEEQKIKDEKMDIN